MKWYCKSAEQGNIQAQYNLGVAYFYGYGVVKNVQDAYGWLLLASFGGYDKASSSLEIIKKSLTPSEEQTALAWAKQWKPKPAR